jgi:hypothetical protein
MANCRHPNSTGTDWSRFASTPWIGARLFAYRSPTSESLRQSHEETYATATPIERSRNRVEYHNVVASTRRNYYSGYLAKMGSAV